MWHGSDGCNYFVSVLLRHSTKPVVPDRITSQIIFNRGVLLQHSDGISDPIVGSNDQGTPFYDQARWY